MGVFGNVLFDNEENGRIFLGSIDLYDSDCILAISHCQDTKRIYYLVNSSSGYNKNYPSGCGGKAGPGLCSNTSGTYFASAKEAGVR